FILLVSIPRIFGKQTHSAIHLTKEPIPDINEEQNMAAIEVQDLPIAVRKGVGAYTRKPRELFTNFTEVTI
ncbi:hypothetical protein VIGAN_10022700, partial [Vigna angularis var. angularis]